MLSNEKSHLHNSIESILVPFVRFPFFFLSYSLFRLLLSTHLSGFPIDLTSQNSYIQYFNALWTSFFIFQGIFTGNWTWNAFTLWDHDVWRFIGIAGCPEFRVTSL